MRPRFGAEVRRLTPDVGNEPVVACLDEHLVRSPDLVNLASTNCVTSGVP
jgi:hypothetical protein